MNLKIVLISSISFLVGLYVKSKFERIEKRLFILNKLESYLVDLSNEINNNEFLKRVFTLAINFENKIKDLSEHDARKEIEKIKVELKKICKEIIKDEVVVSNYKQIYKDIRKNDNLFDFYKTNLQESIKYIIKGKIYIKDDESSYLPLNVAKHAILFKSSILVLINRQVELFILLKNQEEFNVVDINHLIESQVYEVFKSARSFQQIKLYIIEYRKRSRLKKLIDFIFE